ncbi:unnamed protein product [Lathyrus sativus]|nr:unnamed protein product [Lathyrus sativus]
MCCARLSQMMMVTMFEHVGCRFCGISLEGGISISSVKSGATSRKFKSVNILFSEFLRNFSNLEILSNTSFIGHIIAFSRIIWEKIFSAIIRCHLFNQWLLVHLLCKLIIIQIKITSMT